MEKSIWVEEGDKMVNLFQVASFKVDYQGETKDHIGYIQFIYEGGSAKLSFGSMDIKENKTRMQNTVKSIEDTIASGVLGNWIHHDDMYINLDAVGSIIIKPNGIGANNIAQIQFQYIVKRTKLSFGDIRNPENKQKFRDMIEEIRSKVDIL